MIINFVKTSPLIIIPVEMYKKVSPNNGNALSVFTLTFVMQFFSLLITSNWKHFSNEFNKEFRL